MRIGRIEVNGTVTHAVVEDDCFRVMQNGQLSGETVAREAATLLAPVEPRQVIAIGLNYRAHAEETGKELPGAPLVFLKAPNAITGPDAPIVLPKMAPEEVDYEAELVIVVGPRLRTLRKTRCPAICSATRAATT